MADVIGAQSTPPFDIMQMILEGPRGYFGRRGQMADAIWLANQEQAQRGAFAKTLLASPEFGTAMDNPYDRRANWGLWGAMQGGPASIANQGNTFLQQMTGAAYGREQASFEDSLARSRISLGTDEALRLEQGKWDLQKKQMAEQWQMVFGRDPATGGTNLETQLQKDATYHLLEAQGLVPKMPEGYSVTQGPSGNFAFMPTPGTQHWVEAMDALKPVQTIGGAADELLAMVAGKDANGQAVQYDAGRAQQLTAMIHDAIRKGANMGSLDAGSIEQLKNYLPMPGTYWSYTPGSKDWATAREKLVGLQKQSRKMLSDWQRTYQIDPSDPRVGDPYAYKGEDRPPVPKGSADSAIPPPAKGGSVGAGGSVSGPYTSGGQSEADFQAERKARAAAGKEALKKKFPKAAW